MSEDGALARGFRDGEAAASDALVRLHSPRLHATLARKGCPARAREELVQQTWLKASAARLRLDPERPFGPWIRQIAIRTWWDSLRRQRTRTTAGEIGAEAGVEDACGVSLADDREPADTMAREALSRSLASLPPGQREAILLTQYEGLSIREAAEIIGVGPSGVKSRVSRGYAALRGFIEEPGTRPPLPSTRSIELEVAGCEKCEEVLRLIQSVSCPSCAIEIREGDTQGPRLFVDGRSVEGLVDALGYGGTLRALGVGLCAVDGS